MSKSPLSNQTILVTGATSGFGEYVAGKLVAQGARLLLHGRSEDNAKRSAKALKARFPRSSIDILAADFSDLGQVAGMAEELLKNYQQLDVLINNAGAGFGEPGAGRELSKNGYELRLAVNYLAPYLLTRRVVPLLERAPAARMVNVASLGQQALDFNNLMLERDYDGMQAYRQSKLALVMFTFDLAEELKASGITVNAVHPATYADTNMVKEAGISPQSTVSEGGESILRLATDPALANTTGEFFNQQIPTRANDQAYDRPARERLRAVTDELLLGVGDAK